MDPCDTSAALQRHAFERGSTRVHYAWIIGEGGLRECARAHYKDQPRAWESRAYDGFLVDIDV